MDRWKTRYLIIPLLRYPDTAPLAMKRHPERVRVPVPKTDELFGAKDGVFSSLGDAEFDDAFSRDLDLFAGRRIASDAGGSVDQNQLAQPRQGESVLGLLVRQLTNAVEDLDGLSLGETILFSDRSGDL